MVARLMYILRPSSVSRRSSISWLPSISHGLCAVARPKHSGPSPVKNRAKLIAAISCVRHDQQSPFNHYDQSEVRGKRFVAHSPNDCMSIACHGQFSAQENVAVTSKFVYRAKLPRAYFTPDMEFGKSQSAKTFPQVEALSPCYLVGNRYATELIFDFPVLILVR